MRRMVAVSVFCALFGVARAALSVDTTDLNSTTPQQLAQTLAGSGITVSNVQFTGANVAGGTFTGGVADGLGIESGVILSSGDIANAQGPNNDDEISTSNLTPGDADLNVIVGTGHTTFDAAVLEFDFVPTEGTVSFQYVFASDEYNEFVEQFNDVFAFFIDGTNVALIPGTSTPVAINTVNLAANPSFYRNNDPSDLPSPPFGTQFDGFTVVLTATATLTPNVSHHIKLVIADTDDDALDSAVFLQASSFSTCNVPGAPPSAQITVHGDPTATVTGIDFLDVSWTAPDPPPAFYFYAINGVVGQTTATSVTNIAPTGSNDPIVLQVRAACNETVFSAVTEVTVSPSPPEASFTATPSPADVGEEVLFTDTTTPAATSVLWIFGDGAISDQQSVTHSYAAAGRYTVWLFASNGAGFDTASQDIDVGLSPARITPQNSRRAFERAERGRQTLRGVRIGPGGERWLHVRSLEPTERAIAYLRWLGEDGRVVAQRALYVEPAQEAVYDLDAYGHRGVFDLEIVSMQAVAASVVGRVDQTRTTRRVQR